jgi:histidinol-phosphate aminotransferase
MPIAAPKPKLPEVADFIRACATYQPGKPIEELERELGIKDIIKLASNENPLGPSPKALKAIEKAMSTVHLYPDASHYLLREALAAKLGTDIEEIYVGNGSEEIFSSLIRAYCRQGDNNVGCGAAFLAYRVCSQVHGVEWREPTLDENTERELTAILNLVSERTRIVFLPNPNNPTGTYVSRKVLKSVLDELKKREVIVLLDYAYKEYATAQDLPGAMEFYKDYPNLIVTGTFSKIYGLGGMRLGYAAAHPDILGPVRKVKMPFNVSSLSLAAGLAALEDHDHVRRSLEVNAAGLEFLAKEFKRMGLDYWPTQGNFFLVKVPKDAKLIYESMLRQGVIIRPVTPYGLKDCLRVTVGLESENRRMIQSFEKTLKELK